MPLLKVQTNVNLDDNQKVDLLSACSTTVATMLGKSEKYVMICFEHNPDMLFAGTRDATVYLELKSIGLSENKTTEYSAALCDVMVKHLDVKADRIYIEFNNAMRHLWGWNNATF